MGNKIQRIYIGTNQVRPMGGGTFTYDFVAAGSVAQMQSDGWVFGRRSGTATSGWQFTSNGLHNTDTGGNSKFGGIRAPHGLNLTNATKITITVNHYLISGSWNGASLYYILDGSTYGTRTYGSGGNINSTKNSGYNGYSVCSGDAISWNRVSVATGNHEGKTVIDLVNKTVTASLTGYADRSISISDSEVATIKTLQYVGIDFDNVGNYYKDITIEVE